MPRHRYDDDDEPASSSSESEEEEVEEEEEEVEEEEQPYPSLLEFGRHREGRKKKGKFSYGISMEATVRDLQNGTASFEEAVDLGHSDISSGMGLYARILGVSSPIVLGIYIPELGDDDAVHYTPNGVFHYLLPLGAHSNDKEHYLGDIGHLSHMSRKSVAEQTLSKHVKLSRPRAVDVMKLWGTRLADLEDPSNPDLEVMRGEKGMTIFGMNHPVLNILDAREYHPYDEHSYYMPPKEFRAGWKDMRAIAGHLQKFYGQRLTLFLQPVFTDRLYPRDSTEQWKNVKGLRAQFADEIDEEAAWERSVINVSLELVLE